MKIADKYAIPIVEDSAHGLFGEYRGRPLGTFGALSTLSFHETKNIQCGEGGAIVVNDRRFDESVEIIREKGTDRSRFLRGLVEKYTWVGLGSSYLPSDLLAAYLYAQLEQKDTIQTQRHSVWNRYDASLPAWAAEMGVQLPIVPEHCSHPAFMYHCILPSQAERDRFIDHMQTYDVHCVFHYLPLHSSKMAESMHYSGPPCPVTDRVSSQIVRLPFFTGLSAEAQSRVIDATLAFRVLSAQSRTS
jgi:dTDP-4-amino-4,6-dideoxygalactose transaminase